jgi:MraZ protein
VIPPYLRQYADIGDEVVIAGVKTHMEMWNKQLWNAQMADHMEEARLIMDTIERR